jgi:hypothetical protein
MCQAESQTDHGLLIIHGCSEERVIDCLSV